MKRIAHTLAALAAIMGGSMAFTGCYSMSPEGADVFDAAAASGPVPLMPARFADSNQPVPIPVPVPRR